MSIEKIKIEKVMNKYEKVILTAIRARELSEGINMTPEMEGRKITTIATEELDAGSLSFDEEDDDDDDK